MSDAQEDWRNQFYDLISQPQRGEQLKEASLGNRLGDWTKHLTAAVAETCELSGWECAAKGHKLESLPESRNEYLGQDVMAFEKSEHKWRFPIAVFELENSPSDDRIAYSLWKVLCVRSSHRFVFCYRKQPEEAGPLVRKLADEVVKTMGLETMIGMEGETILSVGTRGESGTFPYDFFKWWRLEKQTGIFRSF